MAPLAHLQQVAAMCDESKQAKGIMMGHDASHPSAPSSPEQGDGYKGGARHDSSQPVDTQGTTDDDSESVDT